MTFEQLEHAIRAACDVAEDKELLIFGSQAILGQYPGAPPSLRASIEWEVRTIEVSDAIRTRGNVGHCLEAHDLAASKLVAYREKDRDFVRTLLAEKLIDHDVLLERLATLDVDSECRDRLTKWTLLTVEDL
jgi:hypothetical protein